MKVPGSRISVTQGTCYVTCMANKCLTLYSLTNNRPLEEFSMTEVPRNARLFCPFVVFQLLDKGRKWLAAPNKTHFLRQRIGMIKQVVKVSTPKTPSLIQRTNSHPPRAKAYTVITS